MKTKVYYQLALDNYNQPNGLVSEVVLTKEEYQKLKREYIYIYEDYSQALQRAQDWKKGKGKGENMAIIKRIDFYEFIEEFKAYNRDNQFTRSGLSVLYDYIEELSEESGEDYNLDIIELCTSFTEYDNLEEVLKDYDLKSLEELEENTTAFTLDNQGVLIQNF